MSLAVFRTYVEENSGVDFDNFTDEEKRKWRKAFEKDRLAENITVCYRVVIPYDELGFKTKMVSAIRASKLVGTVERKRSSENSTIFITELYVKGQRNSLDEFRTSLMTRYPNTKFNVEVGEFDWDFLCDVLDPISSGAGSKIITREVRDVVDTTPDKLGDGILNNAQEVLGRHRSNFVSTFIDWLISRLGFSFEGNTVKMTTSVNPTCPFMFELPTTPSKWSFLERHFNRRISAVYLVDEEGLCEVQWTHHVKKGSKVYVEFLE
jgi:hypothetical protein